MKSNQVENYILDVTQVNVGKKHSYTISLSPELYHSWDEMIQSAEAIAATDLSPIVSIKRQNALGIKKELIKVYGKNGGHFTSMKELTEKEGITLTVEGFSRTLNCTVRLTWFKKVGVFSIVIPENYSTERIRSYAGMVLCKKV